ncbi:MAG: M2 family metallopeptidase [Pirellulales bacterium]|nr:M2 family metallopeptidase [Pirellulales bacterium]
MNRVVTIAVVLGVAIGIGSQKASPGQEARTAAAQGPRNVEADAAVFLARYQRQFAELEQKLTHASWRAENSGKKEDFDAYAEAALALKKFHSSAKSYQRVQTLLRETRQLSPLESRALQVALLAFKSNQLPPEKLEKMLDLSTEIEHAFNTFRAEIDGQRATNNDLLEVLRKENDSPRRREIWEALKQVGGEVAPKLVVLAGLRNEAAQELGYDNYWEMQIKLQEFDPQRLLEIFAELEQLTNEPFRQMKKTLDGELARRFGVQPEALMPWHYDNPFFQAPPPSEAVDLDEFYEGKTKEEIVKIAEEFYGDIGLPIEEIVARSDLYEREGKSQHAFCIDMDRSGDVRTLCNVKPTAEWMDTVLHEQGHAVYAVGIERSLPYNLRDAAHPFTTEGVAMLFGALAKNPAWMVRYAGADSGRLDQVAEAVLEQRRREQLIFARWTLVMLHFEKALYEDPDRDLNGLWWGYVERYQLLKRPSDRNRPDWAAKPHFTSAPVYYHSYMLGELFAAQLRHVLAELADHRGPTSTLSFNGRKQFGAFLRREVFAPGCSLPWPRFVKQATGESLTARYFAAEVR